LVKQRKMGFCNNNILIGIYKNDVFIKPVGHITANLSFNLQEYLYNHISEINPCFNMYIDMSDTEYMDSTFLGLLIGLEKKLFKSFNKHLYVVNPNKAAMKYLQHFTMTLFLRIKQINIPEDLEYRNFDNETSATELEKLKMIFFSHNHLCKLSEDNKKRFGSLQETLKKQIREKSK